MLLIFLKVVNELMNNRLFFLFLAILLTSCDSRNGGFNVFSVEEDVRLGKRISEQLEATGGAPLLSATAYPDAYRHLRQIAGAILKSKKIQHRDDFPWELQIIEDDSVLNAFCTPGGYIYVYTGLIKFLDSEDQLAGVLGHEIAHADLRHSTAQLTKNYGLRIIINLVIGNSSFLGNAVGNLLSLNFSRNDETEADMQSVEYLMDTNYDPLGVARFFQKMEGSQSIGMMQFLNTHPNPENRVEKIVERWKLLGSKKGKEFKEEYKVLKASLP